MLLSAGLLYRLNCLWGTWFWHLLQKAVKQQNPEKQGFFADLTKTAIKIARSAKRRCAAVAYFSLLAALLICLATTRAISAAPFLSG